MKNEITIYELLGLIKDNKAPERIKYEDKIYEYDRCLHSYDLFHFYNWEFILDNKVTILDDEKEWEDIEEINITKIDCSRFIEYDDNTGHHKYTMRLLDEYFSNKINQLIKNQKKIIEKLEEK